MSSTAPDYVYLMRAGEFYKIGVSKTPEKRARAMQTGCPRKIEILHTVACESAYNMEFAMHGLYQEKRTHGEWFDNLDEHEVIRAMDSYTSYLECKSEWSVEDKFSEHFREYDEPMQGLFSDIAGQGFVSEGSRHLLKHDDAIGTINAGISFHIRRHILKERV